MKLLSLVPEIYEFNDFSKFAEEFKLGKGDFVLTDESLYKSSIENLNLKSKFVFRKSYGIGEPSDDMIDAIVSDMEKEDINRIIGIGGGTILDICKLLALKPTKKSIDLFEKKVPIVKEKELILIPTTCGTGSEVTNVSIAEIKSKHTKMGLACDELYADYAVFIPEFVKTLPFKFFVTSSIDALIHAVESYVSPKANHFTKMFSVEAIKLIINGYKEVIKNGEEYKNNIINDFIIGSNYAGIAFGNAGVGAVHALSYPLGGVYHIPHGEANYQFFIEVFSTYNGLKPDGSIKALNKILQDALECDSTSVYDSLSNLLDKLLSRKPLKDYGMNEEEIDKFTDSVIEGQQRLLLNNYVPLSRDEIKGIYKRLF
ncbi:4-hydroxybutyrate dehydrogenase [Clostridium acetobutylicum]|uniref:NAD-dependent 4-hydroxybutyrate dehydrogenase n=1 Tax=Clostridium acetobutylicum (strain ATCC 824 / DSM 792 / JCM 1419 / IAM 19013 / LMG 5710 / NBRC 13948 / NRRL B-527 / VKM B-1787 / 2291 / W) TaxID=272562 RepID=Q97IR6_CLOAB|nr:MULTISPECIES: 4-hydroxybutyrate dehydrogenase [Clostridium]AAK79541.1 NAD-dependent 4-hydroxybutyrate dehydrogenase [Clostridium acetobutylicum ATCC 824]ADZ20626.1 NAD-dependent 4-hydroxybutyrate dehydrogenase [Clostridium acetobutylicum EA 2018]AEI33637.1 NAD-dependent 4-hydroxybutyrate dehydrogenase [Clostridium acetobutylicum DSM 1731]AWV81216.1 NAD-dependent alcohol dehydrogenase [Clostridium acetobutylicum]MBC2392847.1 4-hydroxybutyrate dehydrogenase [Clostridium acetobutylicum]